MLPNFIVIGAQKSGTSSLYQYLRRHPQVFMTRMSEPKFFSDHNWWRGQSWYESHFKGAEGACAVGEGSPAYTMYPAHSGVAERMSAVIPDAKLLYVIRHPVQRMCSHYHMRFVSGAERAPIEQALRGNPLYLNTSRYAFQIEQYLGHFSPECLLIVLAEEMQADRHAVLRRVYEFLGVDPDWWSADLEREWNVSASWKLPHPMVKRLTTHPIGASVLDRTPERVKAAVKAVTHRDPPEVELAISFDLERELENRLREDVQRLRRMLPEGFDGWGIA